MYLSFGHRYLSFGHRYMSLGNRYPSLGHILLRASGQWDSFSELPHWWGAVGSGTPLVHCHTAGEQCAAGLPQCIGILLGCSGVAGSGTPSTHCHNAGSSGWHDSFRALGLLPCTATLPTSSGQLVGTLSLHHHTAGDPGVVGLLQFTPTLPGSSGRWDSLQCTTPPMRSSGQWDTFSELPHCCHIAGEE